MEQVVLGAKVREPSKKGGARKLRKSGGIPSVVYGHGAPVAVSVDATDFHRTYRGSQVNALYTLDIDGDSRDVLVKEIQENTLTETILHIDFYEVERGKLLKTTVPLHVVGSAVGVREGGLLEEHTHLFEIECLPKDIPVNISVDVSELGIGESIHLSDVTPPAGVRLLGSEEITIVSVNVLKSTETQEDEGDLDAEVSDEAEQVE